MIVGFTIAILLEAISKVKNFNTEVQRFGVTQRE
jgi:hypothetical protein